MGDVKKDIDGKESSKRLMGLRLLNISIGMALLYFVTGLIRAIWAVEKMSYEFPMEIWWTMMGTGASLLGFTLVERYSKK